MNKEMSMNNNLYVIDVDMENRSADDIARDVVNQIAALFDKLFEELSLDKDQNKNVKG